MRVPGLVLMLSAAALGNAGAEEAILRGQQFAQAKTSNVSCMPIGVTAAGELVFPWECREIIERERGPVSVDLSMPPKETALSQPPPQSQPAAAVNDGPKGQPASQSAEPQHVATIPEAVGGRSPAIRRKRGPRPGSACGPTAEARDTICAARLGHQRGCARRQRKNSLSEWIDRRDGRLVLSPVCCVSCRRMAGPPEDSVHLRLRR
jgi:hypothetical protein